MKALKMEKYETPKMEFILPLVMESAAKFLAVDLTDPKFSISACTQSDIRCATKIAMALYLEVDSEVRALLERNR